METDSQGLSRVGRGRDIPCFLIASLALMAQAMHNLIYFLMSCNVPFQIGAPEEEA
jgi:hypothetical protein